MPQDLTNPVTYTVTNGGTSTDYQVQAFNTAPSAGIVDGWLGRGINLGNDLDAWPARSLSIQPSSFRSCRGDGGVGSSFCSGSS